MMSFCYIWKLIFVEEDFFLMLDYVSVSKYVHINKELMKGNILVQI